MENNQSSSYAVASLVCSLVSWVVFGIILAPLSIVFGVISLSKKERNSGMAIAGIIIGSIATAVCVLSLIVISSIATYM